MNYILSTVVALIVAAGAYFGVYVSYSATSPQPNSGADYARESRDAEDGEWHEDEVYVLQYDAESADQCDEGDVYVEDEQVCEYECADAAECAQLAQEAEAELDDWGDEYTKDSEPVAEKEVATGDLAATYAVGSGESITLQTGTPAAKNSEVWGQIAALSPDAFTARFIETYGVFSNSSDDTLAYVSDDDGNGKWLIAVNLAGYESLTVRERATTLVHELAHIVTLNNTQVRTDIDEAACGAAYTGKGFFTGEGCALWGSYMGDFAKAFWPASDVAKVGGGAGENVEAAAQLYEAKPTSFVTEYAATNPGEDIAESFALFILDKQSTSPQTVAEKKVAFFYNYPALVAFRNDMRQALVTGIVRARRAQ